MTAVHAPTSAFVSLGGGAYRSTELTRGPWHPDHQHAGPPIALVAGELERAALALEMTHIARLTASLLRPVPIADLAVVVQTEYSGRNVAHFSARLGSSGKDVALFTALAQREAALPMPEKVPGHQLASQGRRRVDLHRRAHAGRAAGRRSGRSAHLRCGRARWKIDAEPVDPLAAMKSPAWKGRNRCATSR